MIVLLHLILLTTIIVIGIKIATSEGMILQDVGRYAGRKVDQGFKVFEALVVCEWCMPSVYSLLGYAFAFGTGIVPFVFTWRLLFYYPLCVFGSSFVCGMLWLLYKTVDAIKDRNDAERGYYEIGYRVLQKQNFQNEKGATS